MGEDGDTDAKERNDSRNDERGRAREHTNIIKPCTLESIEYDDGDELVDCW